MDAVVVTDAGPLIALGKLNRLDLLKGLFGVVQVLPDALVLLDDEVARAEARRLKLPTRGTLGLLVQAYREKLLSFSQVEVLIREVAARPDIWIAAKLCEQVLAALSGTRP